MSNMESAARWTCDAAMLGRLILLVFHDGCCTSSANGFELGSGGEAYAI